MSRPDKTVCQKCAEKVPPGTLGNPRVCRCAATFWHTGRHIGGFRPCAGVPSVPPLRGRRRGAHEPPTSHTWGRTPDARGASGSRT